MATKTFLKSENIIVFQKYSFVNSKYKNEFKSYIANNTKS